MENKDFDSNIDIVEELDIDLSRSAEDIQKQLNKKEKFWNNKLTEGDAEKAQKKLKLVEIAKEIFKDEASKFKYESKDTGDTQSDADAHEKEEEDNERVNYFKEIYHKAMSFYNSYQNDLAKKLIDEAITYTDCIGTDTEFYINAAMVYMENKDYSTAINTINKGILVDEKNSYLYFRKGFIYITKNDNEFSESGENSELINKAIQCFKKSIELAKASMDKKIEANAVGALSYCLLLQGKTDLDSVRKMSNYALDLGCNEEYLKQVIEMIMLYENEQNRIARIEDYKQDLRSEKIRGSSIYRVAVASFKPFKTVMLEGEVVGGIFIECVVNAALKCGLPVKGQNGIIGGINRKFYEKKDFSTYKYRGLLMYNSDGNVYYSGGKIELFYTVDNYLYVDLKKEQLCRDYSNNEFAIEILEEAIKAGLVYKNTLIEPVSIVESDNKNFNIGKERAYQEAVAKYNIELTKLLNGQKTDFRPIKTSFEELGYHKDSGKYLTSCKKCVNEEDYRTATEMYYKELDKLKKNQSTHFGPVHARFAVLYNYKQSHYYFEQCQKCINEETYRYAFKSAKSARTKDDFIYVIDMLYPFKEYRNSKDILFGCIKSIRQIDNEIANRLNRNICNNQDMSSLIALHDKRTELESVFTLENTMNASIEELEKYKENSKSELKTLMDELEILKKKQKKGSKIKFRDRKEMDEKIRRKNQEIRSKKRDIEERIKINNQSINANREKMNNILIKTGHKSLEETKKSIFNLEAEIVDKTFPFTIPDETRLFYFDNNVLKLIVDEDVYALINHGYLDCRKEIEKFTHKMTGKTYDKNSYYRKLCEEYDAVPKEAKKSKKEEPQEEIEKKSGCYIATAVYGSYDCPEVWTLRRFRDYSLALSWYGRLFIALYYAISPTIVNWFGHMVWFNKLWRKKLDCMVEKLKSEGYEDTPYQDRKWQ